MPGPARLEAVHADLGHAAARALVDPDRHVQLLDLLPERRVVRVVQHLAVVGVGAEEAGAHAQLLPRVAHLLDGQVDRLHRQHRHPEQPIGIGLAVVREPAIVGAAHPGREPRLLHRAREEAHARVEEGGVDAVQVHVRDAGVRVEPAGAPFHVLHRGFGGHLTLPGPDGADDAEALLAAQDLSLDEEALLAVGVDDDPGRPLAKARVDVLVPDVHRFEHVAVGVDDVVRRVPWRSSSWWEIRAGSAETVAFLSPARTRRGCAGAPRECHAGHSARRLSDQTGLGAFRALRSHRFPHTAQRPRGEQPLAPLGWRAAAIGQPISAAPGSPRRSSPRPPTLVDSRPDSEGGPDGHNLLARDAAPRLHGGHRGRLLAAPLAAEAQQAGKVYRIGFLALGSTAQPASSGLRSGRASGTRLRRGTEHRHSRPAGREGRTNGFPSFAAETDPAESRMSWSTARTLCGPGRQGSDHDDPGRHGGRGDPVGAGSSRASRRPGRKHHRVGRDPPELMREAAGAPQGARPQVSRVAVLLANPERSTGVAARDRDRSRPGRWDRDPADVPPRRWDATSRRRCPRPRASVALLVVVRPQLFRSSVARNRRSRREAPAAGVYGEEFVEAGGLMSYGARIAADSTGGPPPTWTRS